MDAPDSKPRVSFFADASTAKPNYTATRLTAEEINIKLSNDPLLLQGIKQRAMDATDNWLDIEADSPAIKDKIESFLRERRVKDVMTRAYFLSLAYGICLLRPHPKEGKPEDDIEIIHPANIKDITIVKGEIKNYIILVGDEKKTIKADTVIPLRNEHFLPIGHGGEWGLSILDPLKHTIDFKASLEWGIANAIYRAGSPVPIGKAPSSVSEEEYERFKESFKNFSALKSMAIQKSGDKDDDYEFETLFKGDSLKDHSPTLNLIYSQLATGLGISRSILMGVEAGKVSGSETNLRNYYSNISSYQTTVLEPVIRELIKAYTGETDYKIIWRPLFEVTEAEQAEAKLKKAQALNAIANAILTLKNAGINAGLTAEGEITIEDKPLGSMQINAKTKEQLAYEAAASQAYAKIALPFKSIEQDAYDKIISYYADFKKQALDILNNVKQAGFIKEEAEQPPELFLLLQKQKISPKAVIKDWSKYQKQLYVWAAEYTINQFELGVSFQAGDPVLAEIADRAQLIWNKAAEDITYQVKQAIVEGIREGKGVAAVGYKIKKIIDDIKTSKAMLIARTETHRITVNARFDAYGKAGITQYTYHTAGDERVRPTHADMEGGPRTYEECIRFLSEPNCRCDISPYKTSAGITVAPKELQNRPIGAEAGKILAEEGIGG